MKRWTSRTIGNVAARFGSERQEYIKVLWLFAYFFCVASASTLGRTAADTLFLSHFSPSALSLMYVPQSAALVLVGFLFQRFSSRVRLDRLVLGMAPAIAFLVLVSRVGIGMDLQGVYPVIYVAYDVFNFLMIVCFWQFVATVLDQRKAKQMIGLVSSGGIVGGIVSGFGLKLVVPWIGTENLLLLYAGFQLLAFLVVLRMVRGSREPVTPLMEGSTRAGRITSEKPEGSMFTHVPHLKYVAIMSAALVIALTLIDYQFKVILRNTLQHEALAGFMGSFYGFSGLLALVFQLFISGKLLTRYGVMTALLIFPAALLAGSLGVLLLPVLGMAMLVKGSDKVLGDTIYSSVSQLILFPVPPEWRNRAKGFLDGVIRNGAKGAAGISLIGISMWLSPGQMSYLILFLLILCIGAAIRVKGAYLQLLLVSLETKESRREEMDFDLMDLASRQLLTQALSNKDQHQVLYALRVLGQLEDFDLSPHVSSLLKHSHPQVCIATLEVVERRTPPGLTLELEQLLESDNRQVQAQALIALSAYGLDSYLDRISAYLEHPQVEVKAGAIAALIRYYSIEGMFRAVGTLKALIGSEDESERAAMAALFGHIGIQGFYKPLIGLLKDPSGSVRRNALQSAAKLRVPELVPYLVDMLTDSLTRRQAIDALSAYEESILLPLLERYFEVAPAPLHLPKVYERIGTKAAYERLLQRYGPASYDMRSKILEALLRMARVLGKTEEKKVEALILDEISGYWQYAEKQTALVREPAYHEISETVEEIRTSILERIFGLLGLIYDQQILQAVYSNWTQGDTRKQANAAELMDQLLQGQLRMELSKIMSPSGGSNYASKAIPPIEEQLLWLYEQQVAWLCQVIQFTALKQRGVSASSVLHTRLEQSDSLHPEWLADHMARIQVLKQVPLFADLPYQELSCIALQLHTVMIRKGQEIFHEKDPGDALYLIRTGKVSVYRGDLELGRLGAGECIGQTAILTSRPRTATLRAVEEVRLWRLDSASFYELMFDRTGMAMSMMRLLSRRLRELLARTPRTEEPWDETMEEDLEAAPAVAAASEESEYGPLQGAVSSVISGDESIADIMVRRILILQKIELFTRFSQEDFVRLAQLVEEVVYKPGQSICRVDEFGDCMYGIIEGSVRVHRGNETFAILKEGECFGEMALIDSGPRSADCSAESRTVLLQIHRDQVMSFCFQNIDVMRSMMQVLAGRLKGML